MNDVSVRTLIEELVDSDIRTLADREQYLGYAKNVRAGHHELAITGNAFSVKLTREGVLIESLWDEAMALERMTLDQFIAKAEMICIVSLGRCPAKGAAQREER
ncbi:hypothetical protein [Pararhizobium sp. DWP3-4]|uniref:hypothetical protein n=1 Tax=unclassified Pararhizobium TaxID=2643050 RepID=UPI003CFBBA85